MPRYGPQPTRMQILVFSFGGARHAVPLGLVERVTLAAALTDLPGAPPGVLGVLDLQGQVLPVFDLRTRLQYAARPLSPEDQFLVVRSPRRLIALVIDEALGVAECGEPQSLAVDTASPFRGTVRLPDGLVLVHDLERFLGADDERTLDEAMERLA